MFQISLSRSCPCKIIVFPYGQTDTIKQYYQMLSHSAKPLNSAFVLLIRGLESLLPKGRPLGRFSGEITPALRSDSSRSSVLLFFLPGGRPLGFFFVKSIPASLAFCSRSSVLLFFLPGGRPAFFFTDTEYVCTGSSVPLYPASFIMTMERSFELPVSSFWIPEYTTFSFCLSPFLLCQALNPSFLRF